MNTPYRASPSVLPSTRLYGPFPFPWWTLILVFTLFVFSWATFRLSFARDRLECAGGIAKGQCVLSHRDAFQRDLRLRSFPANTLMTVHLFETTQQQHEGNTTPSAGRVVIVFQDASMYTLHELPIQEAREAQAHIRAFINANRDNASFDSGDSGGARVLSLMGLIAVVFVLLWTRARTAPVQLRFSHDTRTLEVVEPGLLRAQRTRFEVPDDPRFQLQWESVARRRGPKQLASLTMHTNTGNPVRLTHPRADGVGVHYNGLVELLRLMNRSIPRPLNAPPAPTSPPSPTFESWLGSLWIGLTCGSLVGLFTCTILGLELGLISPKPFTLGPFLLLSAPVGLVAVTALLRVAARKHRNDFVVYQQLTQSPFDTRRTPG